MCRLDRYDLEATMSCNEMQLRSETARPTHNISPNATGHTGIAFPHPQTQNPSDFPFFSPRFKPWPREAISELWSQLKATHAPREFWR